MKSRRRRRHSRALVSAALTVMLQGVDTAFSFTCSFPRRSYEMGAATPRPKYVGALTRETSSTFDRSGPSFLTRKTPYHVDGVSQGTTDDCTTDDPIQMMTLSGTDVADPAGTNCDVSKKTMTIDTSAFAASDAELQWWLAELTAVERSSPRWVGRDILRLSPSELVQEQIEELFLRRQRRGQPSDDAREAPTLFHSRGARDRFDEQWRACLLSILSSSTNGSSTNESLTGGTNLTPTGEGVIERGTSNTHPLRLQLVACPGGADFSLHVHPAMEMAVVLAGELRERRRRASPNSLVPAPGLRRTSSPPSPDGEGPTAEELARLGEDLSKRAVLEDRGEGGGFVNRSVGPGHVLVNEVGSVHQSYTGPNCGCMFFGLAPSFHVHFIPGNFRQRVGIDILEGIENLLID